MARTWIWAVSRWLSHSERAEPSKVGTSLDSVKPIRMAMVERPPVS